MLWLRGVPAHQAVLPECPDVPDSRDGILRRLRDVVRVRVVVVVLESAARVVGRVDEDAFHSARVVGQQGLQRVEVVALDQHVPCVAIARRLARHFLK